MGYSNAIYYIDDGAFSGMPGSDAERAVLAGVVFSNPAGTTVRGFKAGHGLITGAVGDVTGCTQAYANDAWKITVIDGDNFDLDGALWASFNGVDVTGSFEPYGGSSWADAWETWNAGATERYLIAGLGVTEIRVAKSPEPIAIGTALWTEKGLSHQAVDIVSSTNASPIVITETGHGRANDDFVYILDHEVNTNANGLWQIENITTDTYELIGSTGNGVGGATGTSRDRTGCVVVLGTPQTKTLDNCDADDWSIATGFISLVAVSDPGFGYAVDDILTISTGAGDATLRVLTVAADGPVLTVAVNAAGTGYAVSDVLWINADANDAEVTVATIGGGGEVLTVTLTNGGTSYSTGTNIGTTPQAGFGTGCTIDVLTINDGAVLTVAIESSGAEGGYTTGIKATTGGSGDGNFEVDITAIVDACTLAFVPFSDATEIGAQGSGRIGSVFKGFGIDAGVRTAWKSIAPGTLAAYQGISFHGSINTTIADEWRICLCSDTDGLVIVDEFRPLTGSYGAPARVFRQGGGNLGASIQSIAVYTGATSGGSIYDLDNIIAVKTDGLYHGSLISKNAAEYGGAEQWHTIMSIDDDVLVLGVGSSSGEVSGSIGNSTLIGYRGTTEVVATYIRDCILLHHNDIGETDTANSVMASGSPTNTIAYSGGWDPINEIQNGQTFYDGITFTGYGITLSEKQFISLDRFTLVRYGYGVYAIISSFNSFGFIQAVSCGSYGFVFADESSNNLVDELHVNSNGSAGLYLINGYADYNTFNTVLSGRQQTGVFLLGAYNVIKSMVGLDSFGVWFGAHECDVRNATLKCTIGLIASVYTNYLRNVDMSECLYEAWVDMTKDTRPYSYARVQSHNHNGTGYHRIFVGGGRIDSMNTTRPGGTGQMWELIHDIDLLTLRERPEYYPITLPVGRFAVAANRLVTVSVWMLKDHATNTGASLVCVGGQIAGVDNDVVSVKASDTDWEEVSISMTPTEAGVIEVEVRSWNISDVGTVKVEDVTVTQSLEI